MFLLKLLLCISIFNGISSQSCDITSANACWSPMSATMGDLIPSSSPTNTPPFVKVSNVCNGLQKVFTCTENKMSACSPGDRLLYDTAKSSGFFLCNQGKQGYIQHAHCLFSEASHKSMQTCTSEAITLIRTFVLTMSDLSELKWMSKELCGLASSVRSCLFETAKRNCGESPAVYLQHYMDATIRPLSKFLSCSSSNLGTAHTVGSDNLIPTVTIPVNSPAETEMYPGPSNSIHGLDKVSRVPASLPEDVLLTQSSQVNTRPLQHVPKSLPKCDRYCSVFKHGLPSSIKQGYDDWCEINCRQGFCPEGTCTCNCRPVKRRIVCEAMDLRFKMDSIGSQWCNSVCRRGFCPRHYCKCRVEMDSTYVPPA